MLVMVSVAVSVSCDATLPVRPFLMTSRPLLHSVTRPRYTVTGLIARPYTGFRSSELNGV